MIKELLERLAAKQRQGNLPYKNKRLGIVLKTLSLTTVVAISLTALYLAFTYNDIAAIVFLAVALFLFSPIIGLGDYGESMLAKSGEELLMETKQGFILFLRSFEKDKTDGLTNEWETILIDVLGVGQNSIAIGKPKELYQTHGAPRVYYTDEEWKSHAAELIEKAKLVVIRIGKTQGLLWEVGEAISKCSPEKLLLFHPFHEHFDYNDEVEYNDFAKATASLFAKPLPPFPRLIKYAFLIGFNADGEPYILEPEKRYWLFEKIFGGDDNWRLKNLYFLSATRELWERLHNKKNRRLKWEYFLVASSFSREFRVVAIFILMTVGLVIFLLWTLITKLF